MSYLSEQELQCLKSAAYNANVALQRAGREQADLVTNIERLNDRLLDAERRLTAVEEKTEELS